MSLSEQIERDFLEALKTDREVVSTLRMLKAELKNRQIEIGKNLEDGDVSQVVKKEIRKREEAIQDFEKGGRLDLAEADRKQIAIMKKYLPPEMGREEMQNIIMAKIEELGITAENQFGRLMGAVMKEAGTAADGNQVKKIILEILNNKFKKV